MLDPVSAAPVIMFAFFIAAAAGVGGAVIYTYIKHGDF